MSGMHIIMLLTWIVLLSIGQVLFKLTSQRLVTDSVSEMVKSLIINYAFWGALVLYGLATVLWILILKSVPLTRAHPFSSIAFIIVPILAWWLFNEALLWQYWVGVFFIILGMGVIVYATR